MKEDCIWSLLEKYLLFELILLAGIPDTFMKFENMGTNLNNDMLYSALYVDNRMLHFDNGNF